VVRVTVPADFPNKGKFRTYDKAWNPTGWANEPQYVGQQPLRFPEDWKPDECFAGRKFRP
jgi:hypothetical protein